jgi:hypothetical protein
MARPASSIVMPMAQGCEDLRAVNGDAADRIGRLMAG